MIITATFQLQESVTLWQTNLLVDKSSLKQLPLTHVHEHHLFYVCNDNIQTKSSQITVMLTSRCAYFHILCAHFRDNHICQNTVNVNVIDACDQTTLLQPVTTNGTYGMIKTTSNSCYEFSLHNPTLCQSLHAVYKLFLTKCTHPQYLYDKWMNITRKTVFGKNTFIWYRIYRLYIKYTADWTQNQNTLCV